MQSLLIEESYLNIGHPSADCCTRVTACLYTLWKAARPTTVVLTRNNGLALHHVLGVTVKLDYVTGPIWGRTLCVAILRSARMEALYFWKGVGDLLFLGRCELNFGLKLVFSSFSAQIY